MKRLSIVVPSFNEAGTIVQVINRLSDIQRDFVETIFVDDGSTDGTQELLKENLPDTAKLVLKECNEGKTAAVRAGLAVASGQWVVVQDADLEYDPKDIIRLLDYAAGVETPEIAVYGKRPSHWLKPSRWFFATGVLVVDCVIFMACRRFVRDHASCYKLVRRKTLEDFQLESSGFEGCIEITCKLMRQGIPIHQVPISYAPRSADEGKKLTASYGRVALAAVRRWRNWAPSESSTAAEVPAAEVPTIEEFSQVVQLDEPSTT